MSEKPWVVADHISTQSARVGLHVIFNTWWLPMGELPHQHTLWVSSRTHPTMNPVLTKSFQGFVHT